MSTHGPVDPQYEANMKAVARAIDETFNGEAKGDAKKVGFVLLTFPFGDAGRVNYMSNAVRADMLVAMKEFIARAEGRHPEEGGGEPPGPQ